MTHIQHRYPGPRSFTKEDQSLFVGRENDIEQLENLIDLKKITVVFGKSGTGKSSLLNAGVIPELEKKQTYTVKPVRFFFRGDVLLQKEESGNYLVNIIKENFPINSSGTTNRIPFKSDSLWWHFKQLQFHDKNSQAYLLIIDQFEELGSYKPEQVQEFLKHLNELLNYPITPEFKKVLFEELEKNEKLFSEDEIELLHKPITFKLILLIKSEKLGLLHSVKKYISDILQNCYELNPFTEEQAIRAIIEPAEKDSVAATTEKFSFTRNAVDAILNYLLGKTDFTFYESPGIQTSFLQMICSQIEQEIVPKVRKRLGWDVDIIIEKEDIGTIDKLAENYYNKKIETLVKDLIAILKQKTELTKKQAKEYEAKYENVLKNFLEVELITQQGESYFRKQIFEDSFPTGYDLIKENEFKVLQQLVDYGILRKDQRIESQQIRVFYEICHEKLLSPILQSRSKPKSEKDGKDEKEKAERETVQLNGGQLKSVFHETVSGQVKNITDGDSYSFLRKANELAYAGKYTEAIDYYGKSIEKNPGYFHTYYLRASAYLDAGQYQKAIDDFTETLNLNPDYYESYNEIGRCYLQLKDYSSAYENFKKVFKKNEKADYALYNMGLVRYYQQDYEQSIEYFSQALVINPDYSSCYLNRGLAYGVLKKFDQAFLDFERAEKLEPNSYTPFYSRGICYVQMAKNIETEGDKNSVTQAEECYRKAIVELSKSLSFYPGDTVAAYNRAFAYEKIKDYNNALLDYTELIKKDPSYVDAWYGKGLTNYSVKNYKEAITDFSKVVDLKPDYTNAYFEKGRTYYKLMEYERAIGEYTEVVKLQEDYPEAYYNRGLCYESLKKYEEAISDFSSTLRFNPDYTNAYFERGLAYYKSGDYNKALADYSEVIKRKSDYYEAYFNRGLCYYYLMQYNQAIDEFTNLLKIKKDYADAYYQRALSAEGLKKYKSAIDDYSQIIGLEEKPYDAFYGRGYCSYHIGEFKDAINDLNRVLELHPSYPQAHLTLGASYYNIGDYKKALAETNLELENNPDSQFAYCNRADIYRKLKEPEKALLDVHKAQELNPEDGYAYSTMALLALDKGDTQKFYANLETAVNKGYALFDEMKNIPEFKSLADESRFKELIDTSENFSKTILPVS